MAVTTSFRPTSNVKRDGRLTFYLILYNLPSYATRWQATQWSGVTSRNSGSTS